MQVNMSRRGLIKGLASGSVVAFSGCVYNDEIGRNQLLLIPEGQIAQLAASTWTQLKQEEKLSSDPAYTARLNRVGSRIVGAIGDVQSNWEFQFFESDELNAFALPGGKVGFYTGIMDLMENDAQIATVMGHEIGHVRLRHAGERASQTTLANTSMQVAQVAMATSEMNQTKAQVAAMLGVAAVQFGVLLPYSRKHELEADRVGVQYMYRAGYDPREAVKFWQTMSSQGGAKPPELMSTHPSDETRLAQLRREIALLPPRA